MFCWERKKSITHFYLMACKYIKPVLSSQSKIGFQHRVSLNAAQKYCRMLLERFLQHFRPSLSYNCFCLFLSGRVRQFLCMCIKELSKIFRPSLGYHLFLPIFEWPHKTVFFCILYIDCVIFRSCHFVLTGMKPPPR